MKASLEIIMVALKSLETFVRNDALCIGYKQSLDNTCSIPFFERSSSTHLNEDETFNDNNIINNLIDNKDGQEEPDSSRADKIYAGIQLSNKLEKHFLKI
ncbi:UNVERIFIED_CONTAM: hypothetical protein NCL1_33895 [Trichonephila clavipes]